MLHSILGNSCFLLVLLLFFFFEVGMKLQLYQTCKVIIKRKCNNFNVFTIVRMAFLPQRVLDFMYIWILNGFRR